LSEDIKFSSEDHCGDFWKGAKYGKQGTRQKQGKKEEEAGEAKAAEEVKHGPCKLETQTVLHPIPQFFSNLRDGSYIRNGDDHA